MQNLTFAFFRWLISAVIFRRQIDIYRFDKLSDHLFHQAVKAGCDAVKALLETGTRAGDVDAHKAIKAVHHAGVDPDLLIEQELSLIHI